MKQHILSAIKLTIICLVFFSGVYTLFVWAIAQAVPRHGEGKILTVNGKIVGYENIGQLFNQDQYFWSRPSAVNYNAAGSGGSNKGPSNPDYLQMVKARIDSFLVHNPGVNKKDIPVDLVTTSGSGLDPDISPAAAYIQAKRIGHIRHIQVQKLDSLISANIQKPLLGILGPSKVNVLELNIALDQLSNSK